MAATDLLIGKAAIFLDALALIDHIAHYDVSVVIEGETGTGKELAARAIHYGSGRRDRAFVPVNCGAIPDTLIENELFGHERGAFTDARTALPGLLEIADRGTLFLDEVDALSPRAQVTLLRFLQDRTYRPLGARNYRQCDVRIVAASNSNLDALVDAGRFRADLLFRLKLMVVQLPPLRERKGDAVLLAQHFVRGFSRTYPDGPKQIAPTLALWLEAQAWPGNVRELENFVHRAHLMCSGPALLPPVAHRAPSQISRTTSPTSLALTYRKAKEAALAEFDRDYLTALLNRTHGNVTAAAKTANKERRSLGRLIRKYGIRPDLFKVQAEVHTRL